jgi:hypothetical protein
MAIVGAILVIARDDCDAAQRRPVLAALQANTRFALRAARFNVETSDASPFALAARKPQPSRAPHDHS